MGRYRTARTRTVDSTPPVAISRSSDRSTLLTALSPRSTRASIDVEKGRSRGQLAAWLLGGRSQPTPSRAIDREQPLLRLHTRRSRLPWQVWSTVTAPWAMHNRRSPRGC
jgi:hypothetical protein